MVDPILALIRANVADGLDALGVGGHAECLATSGGLRWLFGTRYAVKGGCAGLPHAYAARDAWIEAGRPLDDPIEDEWLDVETDIGLIVSMKPERVRQARCRLQVLESREWWTRERRLQQMKQYNDYENHPCPREYDPRLAYAKG